MHKFDSTTADNLSYKNQLALSLCISYTPPHDAAKNRLIKDYHYLIFKSSHSCALITGRCLMFSVGYLVSIDRFISRFNLLRRYTSISTKQVNTL